MRKTHFGGRSILALTVVGALCGACDDGDEPGRIADEQGQAAAGARAGRGGESNTAGRGSPAANGGNGAGNGAAGTRASAGAAGAIDPERVSLSDGQIVAVLAAVNATEISLGKLAMSRGVAPAVRNFGDSMATVHGTAQERQTTLAMTLDLTSEVSPLSMQLGEDAKELMSELSEADAAEFDALYLRSQVDAHMKVLMLTNERLLPSVQADELRAELMLVRMEVATHLEGARSAASSLEDTDAGAP